MNTVLRGARDFSWPFALVVGGGLATLAVVGVGHNQPIAAGPAPTTTVTTPPASSTPANPVRSHTSTPHSTPRMEPTGGGVVAASAPRSSGLSAAQRPSTGAPSGPSPRPPAVQQPQCNVALTAATLNACIKLGGSR